MVSPSTGRLAAAGCLLLLLAVASAGDPLIELPAPEGGARSPVDAPFDGDIRRILSLADVGSYEEALALCDSLRQAHPRHPAPHLYTASVYVNWMQSYRLNDFQAEVDASVGSAIDHGTRMLDEDEDEDAWLHFDVASAYGFRALARFRRHNWIGAWLDGRRSIGHFRQALELDPTLYDVYFAVGAYHYWRTARSRFLRRLTFLLPDRRELGLAQMELAAAHGRYARNGAIHGLALAYFDAGDLDRSRAHNERVLVAIQPPTNGALYLRGRLAAEAGDWTGAEADFRRLLERLPARAVGYRVECGYELARALAGQGRRDAARAVAATALDAVPKRRAESEMESVLDSFGEIHADLVELDRRLGTPEP